MTQPGHPVEVLGGRFVHIAEATVARRGWVPESVGAVGGGFFAVSGTGGWTSCNTLSNARFGLLRGQVQRVQRELE